MIRERIIRFNYDDIALDFISDLDIQAFQIALGRMMSYGLRSAENEGIEFLDLYLGEDGKITCAIYPPVNLYVGSKEISAPFIALTKALSIFSETIPTTLAAVPSNSTGYNYH